MTVSKANKLLPKVQDREDFQDKFFTEIDGKMIADFEIEYKTPYGFTDSQNAAIYNDQGSCTNIYMKLEDGHVQYPF